MRTALVVCSISAALLGPYESSAQEFFAEPELDFWGDAKEQRASAGKTMEHPVRKLDEREFRWEDYEDPTSEAFWDDGGDYVPPRPIRVAAADPTPTNVAHYLRWQKRKVATITALEEEVARQVAAEGATVGTAGLGSLPQVQVMKQSGQAVDWPKLEMVLFYASTCAHCQASVAMVKEFEQRGAKVIPVQTDWRQHAALLPGSVQYTKEIAKEQPIDAVPTWIASYGGDRITMQGEVSVQSVEMTLKAAQELKQQEPITQLRPGG